MKLKRVYLKHGRYYFVDTANKWHPLTRQNEGEAALHRALAKRKDLPAARPGSVQELRRKWWEDAKGSYAKVTQDDYELLFPKIEEALEDWDVVEVTPLAIYDVVRQWTNTPRQANKVRSLLSMMFKFACAPLGLRRDNPCDQVDAIDGGPARDRYITNDEFYAIRRAAMKAKDGRKVPSGDMLVCAIDLAYLTFQRQGEIRRLGWTDMDEEWLYFKPTKTANSTGAKIRWNRSPEIDAVLERARGIGKVKGLTVIHTLKGGTYTKSGLYTAWSRACERAKVENAHFHDLRAKAQTDAKKRGYTMEHIQDGAGHASVTTTEGYIKLREELESRIALPMPGN